MTVAGVSNAVFPVKCSRDVLIVPDKTLQDVAQVNSANFYFFEFFCEFVYDISSNWHEQAIGCCYLKRLKLITNLLVRVKRNINIQIKQFLYE